MSMLPKNWKEKVLKKNKFISDYCTSGPFQDHEECPIEFDDGFLNYCNCPCHEKQLILNNIRTMEPKLTFRTQDGIYAMANLVIAYNCASKHKGDSVRKINGWMEQTQILLSRYYEYDQREDIFIKPLG